ncbi:PX domain-containing protein kinase-like protein [Varanus komodoensis]|nr:PX domain-containing protein kinase-like protein [Varanus komodoensis]
MPLSKHKVHFSDDRVTVVTSPEFVEGFPEFALQHVSMFFRSEPKWEVVEPLKDIGWRIRKKYFLMKIKNQPKERLMLSWASSIYMLADLGPDKYLSDKDLQCAVKLLSSCSHPYIYKVTFATANESSALVIRPFNEKGTLKDLIYKVLKFLHERGFPYGHLHASNVMLDGDTCRLLDLENSLLGLPSFYRSYFTQFRKINHTILCPPVKAKQILQDLPPCGGSAPLNIPTKLKEALKTAKESIEKRLAEEQKLIHHHRRLTRAQSHHGSEEEKKRRKILARKKSKRSAFESGEEQTMKYSNSNNSGSGASSPLTSPSSPVPPSTTGASTIPSPPPPPAAPPPPPNLDVPIQPDPRPNSTSRGALLSSIQNFQKGALKKTETSDYTIHLKSAPEQLYL